VIHVSDPVAGIALIVCGLGMFWSARAYVSVRRESRPDRRVRWWTHIELPVSQRTELVVAYVLSAAAVVGGILVLL
jgi:hypothetical protein